MAEPTGKFSNVWLSDDRTELAVEVVDGDGNAEIMIMQVWPDQAGDPRPLVTDICIQPELFASGWTHLLPGRPT